MIRQVMGTNSGASGDKWVAVVALSAIFMSAVVAIVFIAYHYRKQETYQPASSFQLRDGKVAIPQLGIELRHFPGV